VDKDNIVLAQFIGVYCDKLHRSREKALWDDGDQGEVDLGGKAPTLCPECSELLSYSVRRRALCPQNPKPSCKNCEIHCYAGEYRARIREVMRYSGRHLILRGRLDLIFHYLF
jgi:hypothetical protein